MSVNLYTNQIDKEGYDESTQLSELKKARKLVQDLISLGQSHKMIGMSDDNWRRLADFAYEPNLEDVEPDKEQEVEETPQEEQNDATEPNKEESEANADEVETEKEEPESNNDEQETNGEEPAEKEEAPAAQEETKAEEEPQKPKERNFTADIRHIKGFKPKSQREQEEKQQEEPKDEQEKTENPKEEVKQYVDDLKRHVTKDTKARKHKVPTQIKDVVDYYTKYKGDPNDLPDYPFDENGEESDSDEEENPENKSKEKISESTRFLKRYFANIGEDFTGVIDKS